ncbi:MULTISPECIES: glycoside hydrolase family 104 protein [unclassified Acinetobacter]|uniref:glycoside hydrolase family 24 protein n=1 Tax=unclassified Acinetobacter TaxID=196816 RepID=UPI0015D2C649|nr:MULTISPECIES: glycoside hydrolase family 104 protein [unclassified Acinetobacter]
MAKLSQLQQAYANPNMRKMLNLIASSEGVKHGYNTLFGNQQFNNLGAHPNVRKAFKQTDGATNYTTAAGRYQFLNSTWNNLAKQYGFRDFSPRSQDLGAVALIAQRGALDDVLNGRWESAIGKLGKEWASLPSSTYKQGKRSWDFVNKHLGSNIQPQQGPNFVDLKALGYKPQATQQAQPSFVDLKALGYQGNSQQNTQPQFVDLKALGYKG